jgi:hypothetical protein
LKRQTAEHLLLMTERHAQKENLRLAKQAAEAANLAKSVFLANIRQPIARLDYDTALARLRDLMAHTPGPGSC